MQHSAVIEVSQSFMQPADHDTRQSHTVMYCVPSDVITHPHLLAAAAAAEIIPQQGGG